MALSRNKQYRGEADILFLFFIPAFVQAARLLVVDDLIDLTCEAGKAFMDRVRRRARRRD